MNRAVRRRRCDHRSNGVSGLAVAALGRRVAPAGMIDVGPELGLPPLSSRDVVMHSSVSDHVARNSLRALAAIIRLTGL